MIDAYWNRRKGLYSLRQNGRVIGHEPALCLIEVTLVVKPGAIARIRRTGQREVCAWATGQLVPVRPEVGDEEYLEFNPFRDDAFLDEEGKPVHACRVLHLMPRGNISMRRGPWL